MTIDRRRAVQALEVFLQSAQADRRDAAIDPLIRDLERTMASGLYTQGVQFRRGMKGLKAKWQDDGSIWLGDWLPYLEVAQDVTRGQMRTGIFANIMQSLIYGQGHLVDDVGSPVSIAFGRNDPFAVEYAQQHAAEQIRKIDQSTREGVHRIIENGVKDGSSYGQLMTNLRNAYGFSKARARNIAVFEVGDAYEAGRRKSVDDMRAAGLKMVKSWSSVGDSHVRPAHVKNEQAGWIDVDATFPGDGASRPPTDPRCRCTALYQRGVPSEPAQVSERMSDEEVQKGLDWMDRGKSFEQENHPYPGFSHFEAVNEKDRIVKELSKLSGLEYEDANTFVKQWARSSNDDDLRSLSVQQAASREFGIPLSSWQSSKIDAFYTKRARFLAEGYGDVSDMNETWLHLFEKEFPDSFDSMTTSALRGTYSATQQSLAEAGVQKLRVYRGIKIPPGKVDDLQILLNQDVLLEANPLESFSLQRDVARRFGNVVVEVEVDVKDVFSSARSGFGCLDEWEVVLKNREGRKYRVVDLSDKGLEAYFKPGED